jgi:hypothetical protein
LVGLTNDQVKSQLDAAIWVLGGEPRSAARAGRRGEADLVVASIGGGECKAARSSAALRNDTMIVVEYFLLAIIRKSPKDIAICLWTAVHEKHTSTLM